jgi:hypothetical protein
MSPWLSPWGQAIGDRLTSTFLGLFRMFGCTGVISHLPSIPLGAAHHFPVSWFWAFVASASAARVAAWDTARTVARVVVRAAARAASHNAAHAAAHAAARRGRLSSPLLWASGRAGTCRVGWLLGVVRSRR